MGTLLTSASVQRFHRMYRLQQQHRPRCTDRLRASDINNQLRTQALVQLTSSLSRTARLRHRRHQASDTPAALASDLGKHPPFNSVVDMARPATCSHKPVYHKHLMRSRFRALATVATPHHLSISLHCPASPRATPHSSSHQCQVSRRFRHTQHRLPTKRHRCLIRQLPPRMDSSLQCSRPLYQGLLCPPSWGASHQATRVVTHRA